MSNDLSKFFSGHQAPSRDKLAEALAGFSANKNALLGKALLRMTKTGQWVFGIDNEVLETGTELVINPASLSSGYVAWWMGKIEGEHMQPLSMGPVDPDKLGPVNSGGIPPGQKKQSGKGWEAQASVDAVTRGEIPVTLIYKSSSLGGMKALLGLAGDIVMGLGEDPRRVYPIIQLDTDTYNHKEYGQVFTPELPIVGWLDADGEELSELKKLAGGKDKKSLI